MMSALLFVIAFVLTSLAAVEARAQERSPARAEAAPLTPRLSVGLGMGSGWGEGRPSPLLSIRVAVSNNVLLEGEAMQRSLDFDRDVTTMAGNVLFTVPFAITVSLTGVRKVETVSHHARTGALLGAAAGGFWITLAYGNGGCDDCEIVFTFPAAFAGVGAAIGGMINAATANRHVLSETTSTSVSVQPTMSSSGSGLNVLVRW